MDGFTHQRRFIDTRPICSLQQLLRLGQPPGRHFQSQLGKAHFPPTIGPVFAGRQHRANESAQK